MGIQLHFETSGYCSAKCGFCPYNSDENKARPKGFMTEALSDKLLTEAASLEPIDSVAFSGLSEPLLDKLLEKRIALAKKLRPSWFIELYTNGFVLTPERFESLKAAGLDCISVSLNAITSAQHEKVMGVKGKFQQTCENIRYARANKGGMRMLVKAVVSDGETDGLTLAEANIFRSIWGGIDDGIGGPDTPGLDGQPGIGGMVLNMNWAGKTRLMNGRPFDPNSTCNRAIAQIAVSWAGHVNLCCLDPYGKYKFGDLNVSTIKEVYNSAGYVEFREWHRDGVAAKHPLCRVCTRI